MLSIRVPVSSRARIYAPVRGTTIRRRATKRRRGNPKAVPQREGHASPTASRRLASIHKARKPRTDSTPPSKQTAAMTPAKSREAATRQQSESAAQEFHAEENIQGWRKLKAKRVMEMVFRNNQADRHVEGKIYQGESQQSR